MHALDIDQCSQGQRLRLKHAILIGRPVHPLNPVNTACLACIELSTTWNDSQVCGVPGHRLWHPSGPVKDSRSSLE